jgi:hypothetical protein
MLMFVGVASCNRSQKCRRQDHPREIHFKWMNQGLEGVCEWMLSTGRLSARNMRGTVLELNFSGFLQRKEHALLYGMVSTVNQT